MKVLWAGQSLRDENVIIDEKALSAAFREKVRVVAISRPCLLEAELLTQREVETENLLSSVGISPQNGWIADYPVTPIIMGEIQKSMIDAVDSKKLSMSKGKALKRFQDVTTETGLAIRHYNGEPQETKPLGPEMESE
jgi:hypothetical protein